MKIYALLLAGGAAVSLAAAAAGAPAAAAAGLTTMGIVGVLNSSTNPSTGSASSTGTSISIPADRVQAREKIANIEKEKFSIRGGCAPEAKGRVSMMVDLCHHQFKIAKAAGLVDVIPTIVMDLKAACSKYNDVYNSWGLTNAPFYEFKEGTLFYTYAGKTSVID